MGYDPKDLLELAKKQAAKDGVYFIEDLVGLLPCAKATFYKYFADGTDELNDIKEILYRNKVKTKIQLREKLQKGEKAAEILALYKLIATDSERRALSMSHVDHTTKGESINKPDLTKLTDAELRALAELQRKSGTGK
jgi:hypothetical protein